ncbi:MAG: hypothetical protein HC906_17360 [Bacteroidales bacterium]|nr:hypothetical protein [Bacteroidales bacterium]
MILVGIECFLIFVGIINAIIASQEKPVHVKDNSILYLKLDREIADRKPSIPFNIFNFG